MDFDTDISVYKTLLLMKNIDFSNINRQLNDWER